VIITCGHYLLSEEGKLVEQKYWCIFWAKEEEGEFHTLFGHLNDNRQTIFKYFRTNISKFVKFKKLLPTDSQKRKTQWRRSITEEILTLTVRVVHVPDKLLPPSPSEQSDTSRRQQHSG
jgi:hypothetical protein